MRRLLLLAVLLAALAVVLTPRRASAIDHNFAASAQFDYNFVPADTDHSPRSVVFDGMTVEVAFKLSVDLSDHLSTNVKICYGCHGVEMDMGYLDYRVADELDFRVGRFSPSFGSFNIRHDPANHALSDKPLPYDMGRMLRLREWNLGVLPSPFPDNGAEVGGTHWFGDKTELDYAVYAVTGFRGDETGTDLDFVASRSPSLYYIDNNSRPTWGARIALTAKLGPASDATLGASGMYGTWDPDNRFNYVIAGSDLTFRFARTNLRFEYLVRRQTFDASDQSTFKYQVPPTGGDFFVKHGAYVELEQPVAKNLDMIGRVDGLYRVGNVPVASTLLARSAMIRYTLGTAITVERGLRLKFSGELWSFSDRPPTGNHDEVTFHVAAVGVF